MNRLFGNSASKKPKPNLQDAINAVSFQTFTSPTTTHTTTTPTPTQTDSRISSIEIKIRKLDGELLSYKDQLSKLRTNSPSKQALQQRCLRVLKQKKLYEAQLDQLAQQTFNMESTVLATENLRNVMMSVDAMQVANKELKKQYGKVDVDKIEVEHMLFFIFIPF